MQTSYNQLADAQVSLDAFYLGSAVSPLALANLTDRLADSLMLPNSTNMTLAALQGVQVGPYTTKKRLFLPACSSCQYAPAHGGIINQHIDQHLKLLSRWSFVLSPEFGVMPLMSNQGFFVCEAVFSIQQSDAERSPCCNLPDAVVTTQGLCLCLHYKRKEQGKHRDCTLE